MKTFLILLSVIIINKKELRLAGKGRVEKCNIFIPLEHMRDANEAVESHMSENGGTSKSRTPPRALLQGNF
jgi:hypothetical protein